MKLFKNSKIVLFFLFTLTAGCQLTTKSQVNQQRFQLSKGLDVKIEVPNDYAIAADFLGFENRSTLSKITFEEIASPLPAIKETLTGEAFEMGRRLGLDDQALFDVVSTASGQSWSVTTYCPVPGPVPTSPANNDYKPGFATQLMVKDLSLAQQAAQQTGARIPMGSRALELYEEFMDTGNGDVDFSGIIKMMQK